MSDFFLFFFFEKPDPKSGLLLEKWKPNTKTNEHLEQLGGRCQEVILPSKPETHHQTWLS